MADIWFNGGTVPVRGFSDADFKSAFDLFAGLSFENARVSTTTTDGKPDRIWIHAEGDCWICIIRDGTIIFGEPCM